MRNPWKYNPEQDFMQNYLRRLALAYGIAIAGLAIVAIVAMLLP